jgi:hypothetical protein
VAEEAGQAAAPEQPKRESSAKYWLIGCAAALVILLILGCVAAVLTFFSASEFVKLSNQADTAQAKTILRNAAMTAGQYATDHDDIYTKMTAADLREIDDGTKWIDGDPGPGQVGIIDTGEATYVMVYKDSDGNEYRLTRRDDGTLKYEIPVKNPLPLP